MAVRGYSEFEAYSPLTDSIRVRLSICDDKGGEFFTFVEQTGLGKSFRKIREAALDSLLAAVESGLEPGEIEFIYVEPIERKETFNGVQTS